MCTVRPVILFGWSIKRIHQYISIPESILCLMPVSPPQLLVFHLIHAAVAIINILPVCICKMRGWRFAFLVKISAPSIQPMPVSPSPWIFSNPASKVTISKLTTMYPSFSKNLLYSQFLRSHARISLRQILFDRMHIRWQWVFEVPFCFDFVTLSGSTPSGITPSGAQSIPIYVDIRDGMVISPYV